MVEGFSWDLNDPRLLQALIDELPIPLFFKDTRGVYLGCNQRFEAFMGLSRQDMVGRTVFEIAPAELAEVYHARDRELFEHPGRQVYEAQVETGNGERHGVVFHKSTFSGPDGGVAGLVGVVLDMTEMRELERSLRERAETDALTGLLNRRGLTARLLAELARAERYRHPVSLLAVDLDDFGALNRRHGQLGGDGVMRALARDLRSLLRSSDSAARLEADLFLVLLPETDAYNAARLAERLRQHVELGLKPPQAPVDTILTISVGVASYPLDGLDVDALVRAARGRLRRAKHQGRNQVLGPVGANAGADPAADADGSVPTA